MDGGATPLFVAAQNGHNAVTARLLAAGMTVDKVSNNQSSPRSAWRARRSTLLSSSCCWLLVPMWRTRTRMAMTHNRKQFGMAMTKELNCCERQVLA